MAKVSHALAAHWNGYHWKIVPVPNPPGNANSAALVDVAAARPDDAWALGESQRLDDQGGDGISATGPVAYFVHWNGQNWQVDARRGAIDLRRLARYYGHRGRLRLGDRRLLWRRLQRPLDRRGLGHSTTSSRRALAHQGDGRNAG